MITCCYVQSCHGLWVQEVQSWSSGEHQVVFVAFIKHQEHQVTTLKTTSHKTHNEPLKVVIKRLSTKMKKWLRNLSEHPSPLDQMKTFSISNITLYLVTVQIRAVLQ